MESPEGSGNASRSGSDEKVFDCLTAVIRMKEKERKGKTGRICDEQEKDDGYMYGYLSCRTAGM